MFYFCSFGCLCFSSINLLYLLGEDSQTKLSPSIAHSGSLNHGIYHSFIEILTSKLLIQNHIDISVQFSSVAQLCPTLCNPMNRSTPGLPVHHQLPEFTQTHAHQVADAIQSSYHLSLPSPPALNLFPASGSFQMSQLFA